jgi:hypothetical protein
VAVSITHIANIAPTAPTKRVARSDSDTYHTHPAVKPTEATASGSIKRKFTITDLNFGLSDRPCFYFEQYHTECKASDRHCEEGVVVFFLCPQGQNEGGDEHKPHWFSLLFWSIG